MAEEEVQLEDVSVDDESPEDGSEEKKKGLSKPLLIKIAIGVTILIISVAAGAYFFLGSTDEELEPGMEDIGVDNEVQESATEDLGDPMETASKPEEQRVYNLELREEMVAIKEENLRLKQQINEMGGQADLGSTADSVAKSMEEDAPPTELKTDPNPLYYQPDSIESLLPKTPAAEPKWGDFDRHVYKDKKP